MAINTAQGPAAPSDNPIPRKRRSGLARLAKPGAFAMFLAVLAVILAACGGGSGDSGKTLPALSSGSEVQIDKDLAPDFQFTLFQGEAKLGAGEMNLRELQGKPVVLNFWAGLCPPCRAEMPDLQEFYNEFSDRVTLIGIDIGRFTGLGSQKDATDLLEDLEITYPAGFTNDAGIIKDYRILGMPTTIFIDADGNIFKTWGGALNTAVLRKQTNAMLSQ